MNGVALGILVAAGGVLAVSALLVLVRMTKGPTMLDRAISFDVIVVMAIGAVMIDAAVRRDAENLPILLVATLLGFVGSVSIARFSPGSDDVEAEETDARNARDHGGPPGREGSRGPA